MTLHSFLEYAQHTTEEPFKIANKASAVDDCPHLRDTAEHLLESYGDFLHELKYLAINEK